MKTVNDIQKPSLDDDLTHYGVKGMKWGVRRDQAALDRAAGRRKKASGSVKKAAKAVKTAVKERDDSIKKAREKVPDLKKKYKAAKKEYKIERKEVGRKEAKKALKPVRDEFVNSRAVASQLTTGEKMASVAMDIISANKLQDIQTRHVQTEQRLKNQAKIAERNRQRSSEDLRKRREAAAS